MVKDTKIGNKKKRLELLKCRKGAMKLRHLMRRHFFTGAGFHGVENNKASFENVGITANWIHLLLWEETAIAAAKKHC